MEMLNKTASGVLTLLSCSHTESTLRASKRLRAFLRRDLDMTGRTLRQDSGHTFLNIPSATDILRTLVSDGYYEWWYSTVLERGCITRI